MSTTQVPIAVRDRTAVPFRLVPDQIGNDDAYRVIAGGVHIGQIFQLNPAASDSRWYLGDKERPSCVSEDPIMVAVEMVNRCVAKDRIHAWSPLGETPAGADVWSDEDDDELRASDVIALEQRANELRVGISVGDAEIEMFESELSTARQERRTLIAELRDVNREIEQLGRNELAR